MINSLASIMKVLENKLINIKESDYPYPFLQSFTP